MADYDEVVLPGKEGKISVVIKGSRIHPGHNKKSFTLTTNDPENGKVLLFVTANVRKIFDVSNNLALAGFVGDDLEIETTITNILEEPIRIIDYYWSEESADLAKYRDKIGVKIEEIERGRTYRLMLKKKKEIEPGRYMGDLVLRTDFGKLKEKKMGFTLTVNPVVDINPRKIFFGEMRVSQGAEHLFEKKFHLIAARGDSLKVLNVIPSRNDIEVIMQELHPGKVFQGTVKVRPEVSSGNYTASIRISTNYPGYEEFEVAIEGLVVEVTPDK